MVKCYYFGVDNSLPVHVDNRETVILLLGKVPTEGLGDISITKEGEYFIDITKSKNKICLSLHYDKIHMFLVANDLIIYKFKVKDTEIKQYPPCLGNSSKDSTGDNLKKLD